MRFNAKKCYILSIKQKSSKLYSLNGHILEQVKNDPYLGLQISEDMKWSTHINNTAKKASSTLGFLSRNLKYSPKTCKKTAYITLVRSIMDYGDIIWDPYLKTDVDWLERIKHQAARFITGDYKTREPGCITKMFIDLELPTVEKRRTAQRVICMFKVVEGVVPAISPSDFVTKTRPKRLLKSRQYSDFISQNIVENSVINTSKGLVYQRANTEPFKNSFFIKTVYQSTLESFKTALQHSY